MKMKMRLLAVVGTLVLAAGLVMAGEETKYSTSSTATSPALTFGPNVSGKTVVTAVSASTDVTLGAVKFFARDSKYLPTTVATNGATLIRIVNTGIAVTNADKVVYMHASGVCDYTTISSATTTSATLTAGISVAGAAGDALYKITQAGQIVVGANATAVGTNALLNLAGECIFATPGDSPLYVTVDSGTNSCLQVTVRK
jgi:hypothetical protein